MGRIAICGVLASAVGCGTPATPAPPTREATAAPAGTADLSAVIGVWRGTSTCTVRPSSCNDETAVYYISSADGEHIAAAGNRIVDGKEVEMGTLECRLAAPHELVCPIERGTFRFTIDGARMHGRLDLLDGTRFRVIEVERVAASPK